SPSVIDRLVAEQEAFVGPALRGTRRVLEVGCGRGRLAARLAAAGPGVVAVDCGLAGGGGLPVGGGGSFAAGGSAPCDARAVDAVAFTLSLHHIAPLDRALDRAVALLASGGRLVVDDFDLEAPDVATLRWYYDVQEVLAAAGAYEVARIDSGPEDDPVERWRE